jgi:hypothetical protein
VKGAHLRRGPYRPRLEFAIGLVALAVCGLGLGLVTADVLEKNPSPQISPSTTTTTIMINSSVIEPETTTTTVTTLPAPKQSTTVPKLGTGKHFIGTASSMVKETTTTTTEAPKTPLEVALKYLGQTGPWAEGGFYCAKAVSYFAEEAKVPGFISRDGPSALYADALQDGRLTQEPIVGGMIFIDLFGPDGVGHGQVTHVGIVEYVDGSTVGIVQGNGKPDPSVITRTTYQLGDGYIVGFAPFVKAA